MTAKKIAVSKNEHFEGSSPSLPMPFFFLFTILPAYFIL